MNLCRFCRNARMFYDFLMSQVLVFFWFGMMCLFAVALFFVHLRRMWKTSRHFFKGPIILRGFSLESSSHVPPTGRWLCCVGSPKVIPPGCRRWFCVKTSLRQGLQHIHSRKIFHRDAAWPFFSNVPFFCSLKVVNQWKIGCLDIWDPIMKGIVTKEYP